MAVLYLRIDWEIFVYNETTYAYYKLSRGHYYCIARRALFCLFLAVFGETREEELEDRESN